jgi:hypothetical protein
MSNVPDVLGEGGEGPTHVEEGERQGDHVHLLHGVGARARDIRLNTKPRYYCPVLWIRIRIQWCGSVTRSGFAKITL